jgi:SsrA-binding protein
MKNKTEEQGMTLIPKRIYINESGKCKVLIALAKGKKLYDKRDALQEKQLNREDQRRSKHNEF